MKTKICFKCKEKKNLSEFRQCKGGKNKGYWASYCKKCEAKYQKQHYHTSVGQKYYHKYYANNKMLYRKRALKWKTNHPWWRAYTSAHSRCNTNKKCNYYKKGIKLLMKLGDFKYLWFKDKAYLMKHPSIHRIDVKGNYALDNCQYVEWIENIKEGGRLSPTQFKKGFISQRWKK